jgi:hypothetical protein
MVSTDECCGFLRARGWMVASHNDYQQDYGTRTYWSFSKGNSFIDGDGTNDLEALLACVTAESGLTEYR